MYETIENTLVGSSTKYYKELKGKKVICVDFDNTICLDEWPNVGPIILNAIKVLKEKTKNGHKLILYTQRTKNYPICCKELKEYAEINGCQLNIEDGPQCDNVDILTPAMDVCKEHGIEFDAYNKNPEWELMTQDNSRKVFADYFIDDHSVGMKYIVIRNSNGEMCKTCDWQFIDEWFVQEGLYKEKVL